ncbi:Inner membrane protein YdcO [compost metagenome]
MPRYAVLMVLLVGCSLAFVGGDLHLEALVIGFATPVWITPTFSLSATLNIALPLVMVALTGQFVPGMAVLRASGYSTPAGPIIASSALGTALLAPFGCHGLNLAAITAAICTGREAHENPGKRYVAGVAGGLCYLVLGIFGATLVSLFSAFPKELIAALAGLALFAAIAGSLAGAMAVPRDREAALVTFLTTASGMSLLGLSAAFWGLIFGMVTHLLLNARRPVPRSETAAADALQPVDQ